MASPSNVPLAIRAAVLCFSSDIPATRKLLGLIGHLPTMMIMNKMIIIVQMQNSDKISEYFKFTNFNIICQLASFFVLYDVLTCDL